jgi:hypothetical protein
MIILLILYILLIITLLKIYYTIFKIKIYYPFRLAEIYSFFTSNIFLIFSLYFLYNTKLMLVFLLINTLTFYIIYHLINMIQTSPRTRILMDLYKYKQINLTDYLKIYNTEIILKNRLNRFQTSNQVLIKDNEIIYINNKKNFINFLFLIFKLIKKL